MQSRFWRSTLVALIVSLSGLSALAEPLIDDPAWHVGKLDNGVKWQVLTTPHRPNDNVEIRLDINVGSLQETAQQIGFSALLAHLATIHTASFDGDKLHALLAQIAPQADNQPLVNVAYDDTRYSVSLPTNKPEQLREALRWLSEAAAYPASVNAPITAQTAWSPLIAFPKGIDSNWWHYRIQHSLLEGHAPGRPLRGDVTPAQLRAFYGQWYTPDAMTLYVVGNVDRRTVLDALAKSFGELQGKRTTPATIAALTSLPATPVRLQVAGITHNRLQLMWDDPWHPVVTTKALERRWLNQLAWESIKTRLQQKYGRSALKNAALEVDCQVAWQRQVCAIAFSAPHKGVTATLKTVATELAKLDNNGLTKVEFDALLAAQKDQLAQFFEAYVKTSTADIMEAHLLTQNTGSATLSPELYQELRQKFLDGLDISTVNLRIHQLLSVKPTLVLTQPEGEKAQDMEALDALLK